MRYPTATIMKPPARDIPEYANPLMKLEYVTRQFERIGDVATNIAEEVIYVVDGQIVRHR